MERTSQSTPCPICGGHPGGRRGNGERCYGFISDDGKYAHCTREEFAGALPMNMNSTTYAHYLVGDCRCGTRHDGNEFARYHSSVAKSERKARDTCKNPMKIVTTYPYRYPDGKVAYESVRLEPKTFLCRRRDDNGGWIWQLVGEDERIPYRLPELLAAGEAATVFVTEGEKDADNLAALGAVATTNLLGAGKWLPQYSEYLRNRDVVLLPDNDAPGREHMDDVARSLVGIARSIKMVILPDLAEKGDVSDWLAAGGTIDELERLTAETPEATPRPQSDHADSFQRETYADGVWKERKLFETAAEFTESGDYCIDWIVYPWCAAGAITEVDGKVKAAGKTTFLTHMAACVVDGKPFLGQPTTKSPVVYLTEQPKSSFYQALKRAGLLENEDFVIMRWNNTAGMKWPEIVQAAVEKCLEIGAKLLMVDTLHQFCGIDGDDENSTGKALQAMRPLQEAGAHGIAVAVVRHDRKSGGDPADSARGNSAFSGAVDVIIGLRLPEGNTKPNVRVIKTRSRFEETPTELMIEFGEGGYVALGDIQPPTLAKAKDTILNVLPECMDEALTVDEIMNAGDVSRSTADRALKELLRSGTVQSTGKGKRNDPYRYYRAEIHSFQTPTVKEPTWKGTIRAVTGNPLHAAREMLAGIFVRKGVSAHIMSVGLCPTSPIDKGAEIEVPHCRIHAGADMWMREPNAWLCVKCHPPVRDDAFTISPEAFTSQRDANAACKEGGL